MDFRAASTWELRAGSGQAEGAGEARELGAARSLITLGDPPQSWGQGRAMFGGLVAAIALRPMLAVVPSERRLRTLSVSFVAPLGTEPAQCQTRALREGRALTTVESRITQEGSVRCIASGAFAADRASSIELIALMDAWPPAIVTMPKAFARSSSTVSWTIDFPQRAIEGCTTDWWTYEVRAVAATGGYGQTQAWLWDPQGRAVARSTQLVAVFE